MTEDEKFLVDMESTVLGEARHFYTDEVDRLCRMVRARDEKLKTDLRDLLMFEAGQADAKADDAKLRAELVAARDAMRRSIEYGNSYRLTDAIKRIDDTLGDG